MLYTSLVWCLFIDLSFIPQLSKKRSLWRFRPSSSRQLPLSDLPVLSAPYQPITQVTCIMGFEPLHSSLVPSGKWTCAKSLGQNFSMGSHICCGAREDSGPGSRARNHRALLNFPLTLLIWPHLPFPWLCLPDAPKLRKQLAGAPRTLTIVTLRVGM